MDSICFIITCKFGSFKNPFATITSLSELYFSIKRFILLVQTKKVIFMDYGSNTSSWKPWRSVRLDLILSMRNIYINSNLNSFTKFTSSSRSTKFYPPIEHLSIDHEDRHNQHKNSNKLCDETGFHMMEWWKVNRNWDKNMIRISQWRKSHCRTNTSVRRKK